jgi:hypothetical protein
LKGHLRLMSLRICLGYAVLTFIDRSRVTNSVFLDLEHYRCNRVYVPWRSKGRRKSDTRWNEVVRRNDIPATTVYKTKRVSDTLVETRKATIEEGKRSLRISRRTMRTKSVFFSTPQSQDDGISPIKMQMCESPVALWACDGWCKPGTGHEKEAAEVVCACMCSGELAYTHEHSTDFGGFL